MKDTSELAEIKYVDSTFFRSMRRNINCATLTGTAALAAFLATAGVPAQAAKHHHHSADSSSQSSKKHSDESASTESSIRSHHRRHLTDDQTASDSQPTRHHRKSEQNSDDQEATTTTTRHHRHHHETTNDIASSPTPTRHHHHDESADNDSSTPPKRHRHHHEDASESASVTPVHHNSRRHHASSSETASEPTTPVAHESRAARAAAAAKLLHNPEWLAHVARYEAHLANVNREHELRVAQYEAHEENVQATRLALRSGNVVRAAEAFRGTPYVMGGTSRSGFDCSGFTRYIFGESAGVDLPRTAEEQYYTGKPIDKSDLKAGDLVFFRDTYRHGISHVGMYIGDGRFVHACNPSKGVTVSSLSEQYYINHWAGARRVIHTRDTGEM